MAAASRADSTRKSALDRDALSPLRFAIVADVLLRRLERLYPDEIIRAYTDDTAMIVKDTRKLGGIAIVFEEYGRISGLKLNIRKTVIIPLFQIDLKVLKQALAMKIPLWAEADVQDHGMYLGFVIGYFWELTAWKKPTAKYLDRAKLWDKQGLGMQYAGLAYSWKRKP